MLGRPRREKVVAALKYSTMVFLGSGSDDSTEYLRGTDLLPVLEAAVEAMLEECMKPENHSKKPEEVMGMLAAWLKEHNPKRDPEMAAKVQEMRDALAAEAAAAPVIEPCMISSTFICCKCWLSSCSFWILRSSSFCSSCSFWILRSSSFCAASCASCAVCIWLRAWLAFCHAKGVGSGTARGRLGDSARGAAAEHKGQGCV